MLESLAKEDSSYLDFSFALPESKIPVTLLPKKMTLCLCLKFQKKNNHAFILTASNMIVAADVVFQKHQLTKTMAVN